MSKEVLTFCRAKKYDCEILDSGKNHVTIVMFMMIRMMVKCTVSYREVYSNERMKNTKGKSKKAGNCRLFNCSKL